MRQRLAGLFEDGNRHLAAHRWELIQKDFQGVTFLKIVEQVLYRHSCTGKHRRTALNLWVNNYYDWLIHVRIPGVQTPLV